MVRYKVDTHKYRESNDTCKKYDFEVNYVGNPVLDAIKGFVQNPLFTDEGVEKEKGIITQEIKMYEDDPSTISYMGILNNMYQQHSVKNDILGTIESISKIDKEILEMTHKTFYSPNQMVLFVTGNFDVDTISAFIKENQFNRVYLCELQLRALWN